VCVCHAVGHGHWKAMQKGMVPLPFLSRSRLRINETQCLSACWCQEGHPSCKTLNQNPLLQGENQLT